MKRVLFSCLILSTIICLPALAQNKEEAAVTNVVNIMKKAMIDADRKQLEFVAAPELSYGHSSGVVQDKATFVDAIVTGKSDFITIDLTEQTIKIVGNTAIVRHKLAAQTNDSGVPGNVALGVLLIFRKQAGGWKLLARQAFKLPVPVPAN